MNITLENGVITIDKDLTGLFESVEQIDDNFVHISIGGMVVGITPSDTTINGVSYDTVSEFIAAFND